MILKKVNEAFLRSQWRKLELAIKFIHKSKQSAYQNTTVNGKTVPVSSKKRNIKQDTIEEPLKKKQKTEVMKIDPRKLSNESLNTYDSESIISSSAKTNWEKLKKYVKLML